MNQKASPPTGGSACTSIATSNTPINAVAAVTSQPANASAIAAGSVGSSRAFAAVAMVCTTSSASQAISGRRR